MNSARVGYFLDRNAPWLARAAYMAVLCTVAPLRTTFQFGADEGYELMKSFLVSKGWHLYNPIWNDQPPLFTLTLAQIFRVFGPSVLAARLLVVLFAGILVASLYDVVRSKCGAVAATIAAILIVGSSNFAELSVSVMTELPAIAIGVLSVAVLFRHIDLAANVVCRS